MHEQILGIDIGATAIKFGCLVDGKKLVAAGSERIDAASNAAFIRQLASIVQRNEFSAATAVGIGSPGPLDIEAGILISSANMPQIRSCAVVPELRQIFPQKIIRLDNDANAAALGEQFFGAGVGYENFAVFTLGTGVGGGCVWQGRLQRGYKGNFFEVGHIPMGGFIFAQAATPARRCGCGNWGCLETVASATGVSESFFQTTGERLSAKEISALADDGDAAAVAAFALAGTALGLAAATLTQLMNITRFIFTGGMAAAERYLQPSIQESYKAHTFSIFHPLAAFAFTQGTEYTGVYGAAALCLEHHAQI